MSRSSAQGQLERFVRDGARFLAGRAQFPGMAYMGIFDFLAGHGQAFTPAPLPSWLSPGVPQYCFDNSYALARKYGLTYCEGYAVSANAGIPVHHAWNVEPGTNLVIDVTWEPVGMAYFGVPFAWRYRARYHDERPAGKFLLRVRKGKGKGDEGEDEEENERLLHVNMTLLDRWEERWPLFQAGETGWEYDEQAALRRYKRVQVERRKMLRSLA